MPLIYDADVIYDTPDYTYDGQYVGGPARIKDAIYKELRYGPVLQGLIDPSRIKLDMRATSTNKTDGEYPCLVFRRITGQEDQYVQFARERFEIEIIGLASSARDGSDELEAIADAMQEAFAGQTKIWGQYDASGLHTPDAGLRLRCFSVSTVEGYSPDLDEKALILVFSFTYLRQS